MPNIRATFTDTFGTNKLSGLKIKKTKPKRQSRRKKAKQQKKKRIQKYS